ncbi:MAG: extracellular solute-binding protein [Clostridia bacterium]|nr:extracellular solute-binding protein [Clostridia bacterium]
MKKHIGTILMTGVMACSMATAMFATGCGKDVKAPDFLMPEEGFNTEEHVKITFYHTMGANLKEVLDDYIEEFNVLYPNIEVETDSVGSYDDVRNKISTEITVGDQPNIAYCYPDHVALYNSANVVQTLDTIIDSTDIVTRADDSTETIGLTAAQKADFIEGYYNEGKAYGDDRMYTMPFSKSTEVLYYNQKFFTENNLSVPTTWEELGATCARILEITDGVTEDGTKIYPLGYDSEANWFITMCEQYGSDYTSATGEHFLFDNAKNREFVQMFDNWYKAGYFTTQKINGTYTSNLFKAQTSYMSIGSSAGATHQRPDKRDDGTYPFEVGIASIPQVNPNNPKVISQGPSVCIFKKSNPQEVLASWLFVKFLTTSVEFQARFADVSGYIPVIKSAAENPVYAEKLANENGGDNIAYRSAKVCMEQENAYYVSPAFIGSSKARDEVGNLLQAVFTNSKTLDQAFKDAVDECEYSI